MKILVSYRGAPRIRGWETGALIAEAFRELGHTVYEYGNVYETLDLIGPSFRQLYQQKVDIDLWLAMETNDGERGITQPKYLSPKHTFAWFFDNENHPIQLHEYVYEIGASHVFCANPKYVKDFRRGIFLPYAASPKFIRPLDYPKKHDVTLIGSFRSERAFLIDKLCSAGIDAKLIGGVFKEDYIDALASSKIVINDIAGGGKGLVSMRGFESPAAGAITIFEDDEAMKSCFDPSEALSYTDHDHLVWLCKDLLSNSSNTTQLFQEQGQRAVLKRHMYAHRAQEILNVLS